MIILAGVELETFCTQTNGTQCLYNATPCPSLMSQTVYTYCKLTNFQV